MRSGIERCVAAGVDGRLVSHALSQHALCPVAVFRAQSAPDHAEGD
jgi:hypothetical protein